MGTGGSVFQDEEDYEGGNGVIKRIPIEMTPRQKIGKLGLRSVRSLGKPKGGSLRSALSVDLEDPEVTRIRKEFEMYRLNKENELQSMEKKMKRYESECKRMRGELQTLQKTCKKVREERDQAYEAVQQGHMRASVFEGDRDKIQRQFKIFRETKESEIQNLLKALREMETRLARLGALEEPESSRIEMSINAGSGSGDWWATLERESSLGSTTQLHTPVYKGPELAHTMLEMEGPYINVNKDDWTLAAASLAQVSPYIPESLQTNNIKIFISAPKDVQQELYLVLKDCDSLREMCTKEGRFFSLIHMPCDGEETFPPAWHEKHIQARCRQIDQATAFIAFIGEATNRFTDTDFNMGHLKNPGAKPAVFLFKHIPNKRLPLIEDLKLRVRESGNMKIMEDYKTPQDGAQQALHELHNIVSIELGVDSKKDKDSADVCLEGPEMLCGGCLWDSYHDYEQLEALAYSTKSSCELGFEKYYDELNSHVSAAGPLAPLLLLGAPGVGKSLMLGKWIELQQQKTSSGSLVLYHFVGAPSSISADPVIMIRRLTQTLMHHVTTPPPITCDPVRLVDEFPKWLEKVSSKLPGGLVLVLDSVEKLQNSEIHLKWLLDPLPVDCRVIVSVNPDQCPASWRSWQSLQIKELSNKNVKELMHAELASLGQSITNDQDNYVLTRCRSASMCVPLYVVVLASDIARCSNEENVTERLEYLLQTSDCTQLFKCIICLLIQEYETEHIKGTYKESLGLIYSSRNGLSEPELFALLPQLDWNIWAAVSDSLLDRHILTYRSGLLVFAHDQARDAVRELFFENEAAELISRRHMLREYFSKFTKPGDVTYRVSDELPWINYQLDDKEGLHASVLDLCIFVKLYGRGRCAELISYWQHLGVDKHTMAKKYFETMKFMEGMVGQFDGLITLPRIADVYEALGRFLRDLSLLTAAMTPLQRSLEIRETSLDPDHPSVGQSLHQVAGLHAQQGKFITAEQLYKQALEIFEGAFGPDHYLVAKELDALASLYQKQGKHDLAEPLHKRAMLIHKQTRGTMSSSGQMRSIDPLRRRALQLEELSMGRDSPDMARTLNEIAVLYYLQNNVQTAESFFRKSLEMRERVLRPDHPDLTQSLYNLASLYNDKKDYAKAEPLYERALGCRKEHFPPDHPSVVTVVKHLSMLYKKMNKPEKAEPLYREMVETREKSFGENHPSVATALVNLAVLYSQQGKHTEALPLYERALKIYEESFGPSHPRLAETLKNLALLKYEMGDYRTAAKLYKRSTEMKEGDGNGTLPGKSSRRSSTVDTASTLRQSRDYTR